MLSPTDQQLLLNLARASVVAAANKLPLPAIPDDTSPELETGLGAFVTLKSPDGRLRGCIGQIVAHGPLVETIREMAVSAARRDPRFSPVTPAEATKLDVEISVLSPLAAIRPEDVIVGTHGLLVRQGVHSGLLLPQVPVEWGWSREEFLDETCEKAGLSRDAWKQPNTQLYGFTAQVF